MLRHAICTPIFAATVALSACSQSSPSANPLGSSALVQPSHRIRADLTSTSVTIQNEYSQAIALITLSASCLTGSAPSSVPADSTSASFSVSYTGTCAVDHGHYYMTYDPDAAAADACTFKIDYTPSSGVFTYAVVNGANTDCSYVLGGLPGVVAFIYAHS